MRTDPFTISVRGCREIAIRFFKAETKSCVLHLWRQCVKIFLQRMGNYSLSQIDFGQPEAEHDALAIQRSFYEAEGWKTVSSSYAVPFVVGRKGSGKSAIAARLEFLARQGPGRCFLRIVPANFRHVEVRDLLACLVNKNTSWQYIYRKVWEGIILGQIVRHLRGCGGIHNLHRFSPEVVKEIERFESQCGFYVAALGDALSEVITKYVRTASKKTDALSQVELRKMLEPYSWASLVHALEREFTAQFHSGTGMIIAIDGLDEHWDTSDPSMYFLAELLAVTKNFTATFGAPLRFVVCLRDNIFRALVDTKSIEYDKIESLIINLEWNSRSLFEMIARRVAPFKKIESAAAELRDLLPRTVQDVAIEEHLARHILQRPRDYINFFRMLQKECGNEPRAGEGHIHDTLDKYCANRLMDLENEFGFTYPGISKLITALHALPDTFTKEELLEKLQSLCLTPSFRGDAAGLVLNYGQPIVLARILVSIGVVGIYDPAIHALRFVHEFSESRVSALWESATKLGVHPVYCYKRSKPKPSVENELRRTELPAILTHPPDYLAEKDALEADVERYDVLMERKRDDLLAALAAIDKGQPHFRRYELWVKETISTCFVGDLLNAEDQISTASGGKKFEIIFDIIGEEPPWPEIKEKYRTHRLLVECKNTDEPTDADFSKLDRDMQALDVCVAFMAYRGSLRESTGKVLTYQRSTYINSKKERVIVALSDGFFRQCLDKNTPEKTRKNLNALWRDHVQRWLAT